MKNHIYILAAALLATTCITAQNITETLLLKDFRPVSVCNVPENHPQKGKYPVIDFHSHDYAETPEEIEQWVRTMDECGIRQTHLMSCSWIGKPFFEFVKKYEAYKDRFAFWCSFDYTGLNDPDFAEKSVAALDECHRLGAVGVGEMGDKGEGDLYAYPVEGQDVHLDDPRIRPLLRRCGELRMPISIHIAEPYWMYLPMDEHNDGLMNGVVWHVDTTAANCYGYDRLINSFENAVRENPGTIFIACHYLNMNHDLVRLGEMLDKYPNMYIDIAARVAESACTPRATAEFIIKYQDRILFGTDNGMSADMYRNIFRVLETNDEHFYIYDFNYHWYLSGFNLPDKVLRKIYYQNAQRILTKYK